MREASNMSTTTGSSNDTSLSPLAMMKAHMDRNACMEFCSANVCSSLDLAVECVQDFIFPTSLEWLFICLHLVLFTIGVVGNFLVCFVVLRSKHMQTVTNLFIVNLAGADAVVLVLCSPSTVLQAVTESWFLGEAMCKVVHVFQITVVSVSVLTLCAIAVERYFAICRPLKSRITMRKVTVTIVIIWVISGALASPNFHNSVINTFHQEELSKYLKMCATNLENKMIYDMFLVIALYLVPMVVIGIFYLIISHHLWHVRVPGTMLRESDSGPGYQTHAEVQLASRKKVAKMLIAIVLLFAACYLPINLIFVLRNLNLFNAIDNPSIPIFFMFSYWLCYFNSAMNPLIYNFMSAKFKKEFRNVFHCRSRENIPLHYESTWFHSSRIRHNASNQTSSRMLRVHDSTYPALRQNKNHRAIDEDRVANGESV